MYGQPPYDGYQPAVPRPSPPDGGIAPPGRRAAAWGIDFGITVVAFLVLLSVTYDRIADNAPQLVVHGVWDVAASRRDAVGAAKDAWNEVLSYFHQALLIFVVLQFAHQFAGLAWRERTAGQAIFKMKVRPLPTAPAGVRLSLAQAARRAAVTTVTESGIYAVSFVLLLAGDGWLAVLCWLLGVLALVANGLPAAQGPWHRSLGDRVAGTVVVATAPAPGLAQPVAGGPQPTRPGGFSPTRPGGIPPAQPRWTPPAQPGGIPPADPWAD